MPQARKQRPRRRQNPTLSPHSSGGTVEPQGPEHPNSATVRGKRRPRAQPVSGPPKPASGSHVCRPCRHLPASPGASLAPTQSSFSKLPYLFHGEKLKKRKDQVPIQKVRDASSQVVLRHLAGGKERLFAKTLLTAPRGGQAPHCACAVVVPPEQAADKGSGCALWALRPLQAFRVGLKHCTKIISCLPVLSLLVPIKKG